MGRPSVSDMIVDDIRGDIVRQKLRAGDRLPSERELAEHYGLSRIPVREALKTLAQMGLVETLHGKGTFIKAPDATPLIDSFLQPMFTGTQAVLDLVALRKLIESQAAKDAATHRTEAELAEIRALEQVCREELAYIPQGMAEPFQKADYAFHLAIARASGNRLFSRFLETIEKTLRIHQTSNLSGDVQASINNIKRCHATVVEAIAAGDADAAGKAMEEHLAYVEKLVAATLSA